MKVKKINLKKKNISGNAVMAFSVIAMLVALLPIAVVLFILEMYLEGVYIYQDKVELPLSGMALMGFAVIVGLTIFTIGSVMCVRTQLRVIRKYRTLRKRKKISK